MNFAATGHLTSFASFIHHFLVLSDGPRYLLVGLCLTPEQALSSRAHLKVTFEKPHRQLYLAFGESLEEYKGVLFF